MDIGFRRMRFQAHSFLGRISMIGVSGEVKISVNFGAQGRFKWHEGNEWGWKVGQEGFEKPRLE
jgi:hypothetical protein